MKSLLLVLSALSGIAVAQEDGSWANDNWTCTTAGDWTRVCTETGTWYGEPITIQTCTINKDDPNAVCISPPLTCVHDSNGQKHCRITSPAPQGFLICWDAIVYRYPASVGSSAASRSSTSGVESPQLPRHASPATHRRSNSEEIPDITVQFQNPAAGNASITANIGPQDDCRNYGGTARPPRGHEGSEPGGDQLEVEERGMRIRIYFPDHLSLQEIQSRLAAGLGTFGPRGEPGQDTRTMEQILNSAKVLGRLKDVMKGAW
ncbi:hypothetical protein B0H67DRAFT_583083 [Lasiosphaeris hirsuta]|uniref:Uncharacterized protein n=1 Tax=Lasiosphaeris hirsuta TaxID=260670 RepID=A0AA40A7J5_9PEZI|nr:hypothetical protein B0H67DRAFT_583083 [Lasiosphaeris hirsuta]